MKKPTYEETLKYYDELVDLCPGIERKGKSMPYTSSNGHMFSFLNKNGEFGLRFSEADKEKFIEKYNTTILMSHGSVMRGYAVIPPDMFQDLKSLSKYLKKSHKYVNSLPPK